MGEEKVKLADDSEEVREFMKYVLKDLRALEKMLDEDWFETEPIRIGAEQELCLVDGHGKAWPKGMEILDQLDDGDRFTSEFAKFNLEINLSPLKFTGTCLSDMETDLRENVDRVRAKAEVDGGDAILTGILPTIRNADVDTENITPLQRYYALCDAINAMRGKEFELRIQGMDELLMKFNSPLLEACNTGFQVHLQVTPKDFVSKYNIAQAIAGPVLAASVGSPFLFGKRLWSETRIALFQQSIDVRTAGGHRRESSSRVSFGNEWVNESILEIFREDTARHRVLLSSKVQEDVEKLLDERIPPQLSALQVHNGTIYRWNRPCYGVTNGKAHLRIENRIFPSGPTVPDEIANAAFWLGLLNKMGDYHPHIQNEMDFKNARHNFIAASKLGLETSFRWIGNEQISAQDLITRKLLPIAREGLLKADVNSSDIDYYLNIIKARTEAGQTASNWMTDNYAHLKRDDEAKERVLTAITATMIHNQKEAKPVHQWEPVETQDFDEWEPTQLLVEEFMTTDLFTAQKDDSLEFISNLLDWRRISYLPVEDDSNRLVGLVTMRRVFRRFSKKIHHDENLADTVGEIMVDDPITISPGASIIDAMDIMSEKQIGCLPVVKDGQLVGVVTEQNFMSLSSRLLRVLHSREEKGKEE